jgi:hypothetical protein
MATKKVASNKATSDTVDNDRLDPKEEKLLDMILNGIVIFVLGWLGLGILLSVGGLFHLWG